VSASTVDVVMATFNGEAYLGRQLDSLSSQREVSWRLLVADDGSTDGTLAILNAFKARSPDQVVMLPPSAMRLGPAASFGRLLGATSAPYVFLCDQDDVWEPSKLHVTLERMRDCQGEAADVPVLVHSDLAVVDERLAVVSPSLNRYQHLGAPGRRTLRHLLVQNSVTGCTVCVNRALLELALPIPASAIMHDWWLAIVAAALGKVSFIPEPLVRYRQHAGNAVGARRGGWPRAVGPVKDVRRSLARTYAQADTLVGVLGSRMSTETRAVAEAYARLSSLGPYSRRVQVLRHRFFKHGVVKSVGMFLMM